MDFARKQLEKYGWTEGKGLGKNETGISSAIKPQLKFDKHGIGHDGAEAFTNNWWDRVYNEASNNIKVTKDNNTVQVIVKSKDSVNITTKKKSKHKDKCNLEYGTFLKKSKLTSDGIIQLNVTNEAEIDKDIKEDNNEISYGINSLTDEELFVACGRRTAHKGARHGLNLNGKLARLEAQEFEFLSKMNKTKNETKKFNLENENVEEAVCGTIINSNVVNKKRKFMNESVERIKKRVINDQERNTKPKRNLTEESPNAEKAENRRRKTETKSPEKTTKDQKCEKKVKIRTSSPTSYSFTTNDHHEKTKKHKKKKK